MRKMYARARVVLKAAPTWLVGAATVLTVLAEELDAWHDFGVWAARAVVWIGTAVTIIRRVTPVLPDERGVLPQ